MSKRQLLLWNACWLRLSSLSAAAACSIAYTSQLAGGLQPTDLAMSSRMQMPLMA
jgi:hypothetical protein